MGSSNSTEAQTPAPEASPPTTPLPAPPAEAVWTVVPVIHFSSDGAMSHFFGSGDMQPIYFVLRFSGGDQNFAERFHSLGFPSEIVDEGVVFPGTRTALSNEETRSVAYLRLRRPRDLLRLLGLFMLRYLAQRDEGQDQLRFVGGDQLDPTTISLPNWPLVVREKGGSSLSVSASQTTMAEEALSALAIDWPTKPARIPKRSETIMRGWLRKATETTKGKILSVLGVAVTVGGGAAVTLGGFSSITRKAMGLFSKNIAVANALFDTFTELHKGLVSDVKAIARKPPSEELYRKTLEDLRLGLERNQLPLEKLQKAVG